MQLRQAGVAQGDFEMPVALDQLRSGRGVGTAWIEVGRVVHEHGGRHHLGFVVVEGEQQHTSGEDEQDRGSDRQEPRGRASAAELDDVVTRTRAGKARLDELKGGTFTMTSVGSIGGVLATPILNVPEVAILGVNAIREQAVVRNGQIVIRPMMFLSPSFDHRVIDGATGARFVAALKDVIEHPEKLLLELA